MKKKSVSVDSQTHGDTTIQPNARDHQELDWYVQKIKKNKEK